MFGLGTQELVIILLIALFVFGGKKLPEIGSGLGKGLRAFKKGIRDVEKEVDPDKALKDDSSGATARPKDSEGGGPRPA